MHAGPTTQRWQFDIGRFLIGIFMLTISLRFIAMPLIVLWSIRPPRHRLACSLLTGLPLVAALASPIDIGMPRFGSVEGNVREGIRIVRVNQGMPRHNRLVKEYGEYVTTGCGGLPCFYQPTYWVVWWKDA